MRIKNLEVIPLVRKLDRVFQGGTYKITDRHTIIARAELEGGVVGEIFGGDEVEYQDDVVRLVNTVFRPLLVGEDVRDLEKHWERLWETPVDLGNRGIHTLDLAKHCAKTQAIAAVDLALWDALGKALSQPVYKLLGGYRNRVPAIVIGGYMNQEDPLRALEKEVGRINEAGLAGMKLKVGKGSVELDIERARAARRAGGPGYFLCVDANQSWTVEQAMRFARGVQDLNLKWIEEPVQWQDQIEGNARVRALGIPVNAGQGEISRHGCRDLIVRGAVDILNVDATIAAGATEWRKIAAMASCFGVPMAHHEEPQVALHLLASIPHGLAVETFLDYERDPMWFDLPEIRPTIKDGFMHLSDRPGFGVPLRRDVIERWSGDRGPRSSTCA